MVICRNNLHYRIKLDRRRFEAAHLKYALLMTQSQYPHIDESISVSTEVYESIKRVTPKFYTSFCMKYSGKYSNMLKYMELTYYNTSIVLGMG